MATFTCMFLVNDRLVWCDKTAHKAWNYGACDAHAFFSFAVIIIFRDNMLVHALDVLIENATTMV